jgi:hypothetical protein
MPVFPTHIAGYSLLFNNATDFSKNFIIWELGVKVSN